MARPSRLYLLAYNSLQAIGCNVSINGVTVKGCSVHKVFLEVIRYSHYALTTLKVCPAWMTYLRPLHLSSQIIPLYLKQLPTCRYTAFIPLYPIGVGPGEMWTMYQALPFVKERDLYSGFFAKFSMSYHSFLVGVLLCYPLLWLKLYLHVFKQRKSKLGKGGRKKRA
ncbi:hypothetical protein TRIUR3_04037 [Triticum urartu]|uniref:Very-long-chain (3R)-3-hydroxyacyl-CoA dehydratase n=1 Tax=Triticum urartu TaxID=4572 RepID=M7ZB85_TRIUA|nr:hypothetical protein TRIUR3_04037 [Triticum urartu]